MVCLKFKNDVGFKTRLWLGEIPTVALLPQGIRFDEQNFECGNPAAILRTTVAIEILRPHGGSFAYGLLGGDYRADHGGTFRVAIPAHEIVGGATYGEALAGILDVVTVGVLAELLSAISRGIQEMPVRERPCGTFAFTCMAFSDVGSAPIVFSSLARTTIRALYSPEPTSLQDMRALLSD